MTDPLTLYRLFERGRMIGAGRRVACFRAGEKIEEQSYEDFAAGVTALATALQNCGLQPGQRIATLATNTIQHLQLMWAAPLAGGVFHAVNPRLSPEEIRYIIDDADDRFLFIDAEYVNMAKELSEDRSLLEVYVLGAENAPGFSRMIDLTSAVSADTRGFTQIVTDENAPAVLCYTSGTTGRPKGVTYSHRALTLHALTEAMVDGYGICNADHVLLLVPFCHGAGWGVPYSAFMCGADIAMVAGTIRSNHVLDIFTDYKITFTGAVPEIIGQFAEEIAEKNLNFTGLRILMGGTAPHVEKLLTLQAAGITCMLCWGMTETLSAATMRHFPPGLGAAFASQGQFLPLTELSLSDEKDGARELLVRGPCVIDHYYGKEKFSARENGWFATGDTADIAPNGVLRLHDRKKDLIKSGGEWISPAALEEVISELSGVKKCVVIGIPHSKWGERPLCILETDKPIVKEDIVWALMATNRFAKWQMPDDVITIGAIPVTPLGKLDRQLLRVEFCNYFQGK